MTATRKHIPGKRLKTAWRNAGRPGRLKTFALTQIVENTKLAETAKKWAGGKLDREAAQP